MSNWSFRRRLRIFPGIRLNFSKNGISTSIGMRGANFTFSKKGTYLNTGLPGTGIYKRERISSNGQEKEASPLITDIESVNNIFSAEPEKITSQDMQGIKKLIIDAHNQKEELKKDILKIKKTLLLSKFKLVAIYILIFGLFFRKISIGIKKNIENQKDAIKQLEEQKNNSCVKLDIEFDGEIKEKYERVIDSFRVLTESQKIWDITKSEDQNRATTRSAASRIITRRETKFSFADLEDIKYQQQALYFKNINGADLFFYPNFIIMKNNKDFGVIGLDELNFDFNETEFVELEKVPGDSKIVKYTWFKVNKNGDPDKRFKNNYQISIVRYGNIVLGTSTGVNEEYQFSNYEACEKFANNFLEYKKTIAK